MPKAKASTAVTKPERTLEDCETTNQMLGVLMYAGHLQRVSKADQMKLLIQMRAEDRHLDLGFLKFDHYLDSPRSPMSSSTFYRELALYENEGEQYDLFNEWKIPARLRRQLTAGDISIDGDEVVVAGERVSLANSGSIKAILEQLVKEKLAAQGELTKTEKEMSRLKETENKYKELRAEIDEENDKPEYVIAYLATVETLLTFIAEIKDLPGDVKGDRAWGDLDHMAELFRQLFDAYGESFISWLADQKLKAKTKGARAL